jgi:CubicO group peptidase (beta-lactamase class C family)
MSDVNDRVSTLIEKQVTDGRQIGVQVSAYQDGEKIVDTWAGAMGPDDPRPVQSDSLFCSWSTTKGVTATAIHMLADRGLIDYDARVADYWPEFAQEGKEGITVTQAMSHQAGIHALPAPFSVDFIIDWDAGIEYIEKAKPAYKPGTKTGYHAFTFGLIAGGIVKAVTGRHIKEFISNEIAKPLGVEEEMFVGIPEGVEDQLTTLEIWDIHRSFIESGLNLPEDHDFFKAMPNEMWKHFNEMRVRKACIPAGNGYFTARALAKMYAALAGDGSIDGARLVSLECISDMQRLVKEDLDIVIGRPANKGIGFGLGGVVGGITGPMGPRKTAFGHGGAGGSIAFADPEVNLAVVITLNKMEFEPPGGGRAQEICDLIRTELGVE